MRGEREYEFVLVVDGVSMDDDEAVATLADAFDGVLSWNRGLYRLAVSGNGRDSFEAASRLVSHLRQHCQGLGSSVWIPNSSAFRISRSG